MGEIVLDLGVVGDNLAEALQCDLPGSAVDMGADIVLVAVFGPGGLLDRLFHGLQHFVALDPLLLGDGVGDRQHFQPAWGNHRIHVHYLPNLRG